MTRNHCFNRLERFAGDFAPGKGVKTREYFVYFKVEQRVTGAKDPQCAEDAFIQWIHKQDLRLETRLARKKFPIRLPVRAWL